MGGKIVISAALAGAATMKTQNSAVPYTPEEFAEESHRCMSEGAAVVHIHTRAPDSGLPTADIDKIRTTIEAIRDRCPGLIINMSTAIGPGVSREDRIAPVVAIEPEMTSLNTNSMNAALANKKTKEIKKMIVAVSFLSKNPNVITRPSPPQGQARSGDPESR